MGQHGWWAGALTVLIGVLAALVPVTAAQADFATQCTSPTRTVAPTDTSITVAPGEVVLVASDFTGGIDALPAGGTLCVAPDATLNGLYMNNAAGAVVVAPGAELLFSNVVVNAGFSLELEGSATLGGFGTNGSADVHVYPDGQLVVGSSFSPAGGSFVNEGGFQIQGGLDLNTGAVLNNSGSLAVLGIGELDGVLDNSGLATFDDGLTVNSSGALQNTCAIGTLGELVNDSPAALNSGVIIAEGVFRNNGTWQQSGIGVVSAGGLLDDGSITGVGGFRFSGTTSVQGSFVGDSAVDPIRVQTQAPEGQIFDLATGTVVNVVRATVDVPTALPACAEPGNVSADVAVTKSGPATVLEGGTVTYELTVTNSGPDDATDVVVTDALPSGFVLDPASTTGVLTDGALTWQVGALAVGDTVTLTFSGTVTAPAGSVLTDVASSTSSTEDRAPSNNDGSADASRVSTLVVAVHPPNVPPVADDLVRTTVTGAVLGAVVTATDPDVGQTLSFRVTSPPASGLAVLLERGAFVYESLSDFAGVDSFEFEVCDNASPTPGCDTGTVTINVYPVAADDIAQTFVGVPVTGPVLANDTDGAPLDPDLVSPPVNGTAVLDLATGDATYTPDAGFSGVDSFQYRICSPTQVTFCDTATVTVTVVAVNAPPSVEPLALTTTTGSPVAGELVTADPDVGDVVTATAGVPPGSGTAQVDADGATTYTPGQGYAGRDAYGVIVCDDGTPVLCSTGTVTVDVYPVAAPDAAATQVGAAVVIAVAGNDAGSVLDPEVTGAPAGGTVTFSGSEATYVPNPGFSGVDTFRYTICAATAPDLCATTTVTVTVAAAPAPPDPTPGPPPGPQPPGPAPPGPQPGGDGLAVTGSDAAGVAALALGGLLLGATLLLIARRRRV